MIVDCAHYRDGCRQGVGPVPVEEAAARHREGGFVWLGMFEPAPDELDRVRECFAVAASRWRRRGGGGAVAAARWRRRGGGGAEFGGEGEGGVACGKAYVILAGTLPCSIECVGVISEQGRPLGSANTRHLPSPSSGAGL